MPYVPDHILDQMRQQLPIDQLLGEYVHFTKRSGKNLYACCPFHEEKTPSFSVSPDRGYYKCFGCGASGNIFTFLMEHEGLTFFEAVEEVSRRTGIEIPRDTYAPGARQSADEKERLFTLAKQAAAFFRKKLQSEEGGQAREYLAGRGLSEDIIQQFDLGYAPMGWDSLLKAMGRGKRSIIADLGKVGLVRERNSGEGHYDFFRHKVMFPIRDLQGRVVAFGGRKLPGMGDDDGPKYINSPETALYRKSHVLYGLDTAKDAIRKQGRVYLVEGYMDLIGAVQCGVENTVATLGTSLTEGHAGLIKRFTNRVTFVYDGDRAGQQAMLRGIKVFLPQELGVRALTLPDGHDPDSFLREQGNDAFLELENAAPDGFAYLIRTEAQGREMSDVTGRREFLKVMSEYFGALQSALERDELVQRIGDFLRIDPRLVQAELQGALPKNYRKPEATKGAKRRQPKNTVVEADALQTLQARTLWFMLNGQHFAVEVGKHLTPSDFTITSYRAIADIVFRLVAEGRDLDVNRLIDRLAQENLIQTYEEIHERFPGDPEHEDMDCDAELQNTIGRLQTVLLKLRVKNMHGDILEAMKRGDTDSAKQFIDERRELQQRLHYYETLGKKKQTELPGLMGEDDLPPDDDLAPF